MLGKLGRHTKLTPENQEKILSYIRVGSPIRTACLAVGVSHVQYYDWLKRGRTGEEPYATFVAEVSQARALAEVRNIAIATAGKPGWQGAAWNLDRQYPERWGVDRHTNRLRRDKLRAEIAAI